MKPIIQYPDFDRVDLRVGKIVEATVPEWSEKLLEFKVNFGPEIGDRTIFSGVKQFFQPEQFVGNKYVFVVNLEPRKMGPEVSEGMMVMVSPDEASAPIPIKLNEDAPEGAILR